ncbi:hypothetical protein TNCV_5091831 [Trichonephila clavipes]|nr:hypothetical protein TNCV_5091831 [Trichonephila clavipes]
MSIVGSSVACEQINSIASNIISDEWYRLDPSRLDRLFLKRKLQPSHGGVKIEIAGALNNGIVLWSNESYLAI